MHELVEKIKRYFEAKQLLLAGTRGAWLLKDPVFILVRQWLRLPNNSIRILVACGAASAIVALFNTPLAGVIFAMEVVMMEYTISGFTPVILTAVSATTLNRLVFDSLPTFIVPELGLQSLWELVAIVAMGIGGWFYRVVEMDQ